MFKLIYIKNFQDYQLDQNYKKQKVDSNFQRKIFLFTNIYKSASLYILFFHKRRQNLVGFCQEVESKTFYNTINIIETFININTLNNLSYTHKHIYMRAAFKNDNFFLATKIIKQKQSQQQRITRFRKLVQKKFRDIKYRQWFTPLRAITQRKIKQLKTKQELRKRKNQQKTKQGQENGTIVKQDQRDIKIQQKYTKYVKKNNNQNKQQFQYKSAWSKNYYEIKPFQDKGVSKQEKQRRQLQKIKQNNQKIINSYNAQNAEDIFKVNNPFTFSNKTATKTKQDLQFEELKNIMKSKKQQRTNKKYDNQDQKDKQKMKNQEQNNKKLQYFLSEDIKLQDLTIKQRKQNEQNDGQHSQKSNNQIQLQINPPNSINAQNNQLKFQQDKLKFQNNKQAKVSNIKFQCKNLKYSTIKAVLDLASQQQIVSVQQDYNSDENLDQQQKVQKLKYLQRLKNRQIQRANKQLLRLQNQIKYNDEQVRLNKQKIGALKEYKKEKEEQKIKLKKARQQKNKQRKLKLQLENKNPNDDQKQKNGKTKIRKTNNYQRLDLKRRYKDRFVGGIRQNQRKYMKNGALKFKYRLPQSQMELQDEEVHNIFLHSLSKHFTSVRININSDSDQSDEQYSVQIPTVQQSTKQNLTKLIDQMFGFQSFRQGQYEVIKSIINRQSTIFVSQTASGKSLTYIVASLIMSKQYGGMSIVISPLIALMLDQIQHLPSEIPAACITSLLNYPQRQQIVSMIKQDKIKLLFMTPQMLMTDILFHLKQFPAVNFVCIDQAHCLSQFSHNFRTSYLALSQIIMNQINYNNEQKKSNILCLTATANTQTIQSLQTKLNIHTTIKSSSTLNKNLYITITRQIGPQSKYKSLVEYLNMKEIIKCKGILIYCRAKWLIDKVFNYLINSGKNCTVFHGGLTNVEKNQIITQFKSQKIKIIISTTALGMGLDFQHLQCVIHFNMPKSLQSFVQQTGRAGRRQTRAYCQLFLDQSDFLAQRNYILADELQIPSLKTIIKYIQKSYASFYREKKYTEAKKQSKQKQQEEDQIERVIKKASMAIQKIEQQQIKRKQMEAFFEDQLQQNPFLQSQLLQKSDEQPHEQGQEIDCEQNGYNPLYFIRVKQLSQMTYLRQQALLTILIKISQMVNIHFSPSKKTQNQQQPLETKRQKNDNNISMQSQMKPSQLKQINQSKHLVLQQIKIMKILPLSYEILKLSFFKSNQKDLMSSQYGQFYKNLIDFDEKTNKPKCKKVTGAYHINLISKCNQIKLTPIQILTKVYQISNHYTIKVQFVNQVYLFSFQNNFVNYAQQNYFQSKNSFKQGSFKDVLQTLNGGEFQQKIIKQVNQIQNVSMTKLNVLYSLAFNYSQISVQELQKKKLIIPRQHQMPKDTIMNQITKYFNSDLNSFYSYIAQTQDQQQRQMYLPTQTIDKSQYQTIYQHIKLFFKHQYSNLRDVNDKKHVIKRKQQIYNQFMDGKIITRVFLGVNEQKSSRMIYGEHSYWKKFILKKYKCLLLVVRQLILKEKQDLLNS